MIIVERNIMGVDGTSARLTGYVLDNSQEIDPERKRPAIIVVPGGGYEFTSDREADPIAMTMVGQGFHAFILRYSVSPSRFPTALIELATAVKLIRDHAHEWHVDPNAIITAGFSAGGHLCACLGTGAGDAELHAHRITPVTSHPNGMMLAYPVITTGEYAHSGSFKALLGDQCHDPLLLQRLSLEKHVSNSTPPTFMWHTATDDCVPVQNTLLFVNACILHHIPVEAHIYPHGGHGLSLGSEETAWHGTGAIEKSVQSWPRLFTSWVCRLFQ